MDYGPLVSEEIEGGAELLRRLADTLPVQAAFWLKQCDNSYRYLYIVLENIGERMLLKDYGQVTYQIGSMGNQYVNPFRVNLVGADDSIVARSHYLSDGLQGRTISRNVTDQFGEPSTEDVYVYPALAPAAA